jgi:hypothetical protein
MDNNDNEDANNRIVRRNERRDVEIEEEFPAITFILYTSDSPYARKVQRERRWANIKRFFCGCCIEVKEI